MKNRMREIRTSGSVGDGDGNVPIYSAMTPLSTCSVAGSPATGQGSSMSRSFSRADLSKTE